MDFTYHAYSTLIQKLVKNKYAISSYSDWKDQRRCVILRHDIDNDIEKACILARLEYEIGVKSTYFVLVTSDFYNVLSSKSEKMLKEISSYGHDIGLHFDEVRYTCIHTPEDAVVCIKNEANLLSQVVGRKIESVSMHRPSKMILDADLVIPGMVNSYGNTFFKEFKYVSDSRRRWREQVDEIVSSGDYNRLHILTHAIWYNEEEIDLHDSLLRFINKANVDRYSILSENFSRLSDEVDIKEVKGEKNECERDS